MKTALMLPIALVAKTDGPESTIRNHRRMPAFADAFETCGRLVLCNLAIYRQRKAEHQARLAQKRMK